MGVPVANSWSLVTKNSFLPGRSISIEFSLARAHVGGVWDEPLQLEVLKISENQSDHILLSLSSCLVDLSGARHAQQGQNREGQNGQELPRRLSDLSGEAFQTWQLVTIDDFMVIRCLCARSRPWKPGARL